MKSYVVGVVVIVLFYGLVINEMFFNSILF